MHTPLAPITQSMHTLHLTKFEVSRIVGMRALQLSEGAASSAQMEFGMNPIYLAALELKRGLLDIVIVRNKTHICVRECSIVSDALDSFLKTFYEVST